MRNTEEGSDSQLRLSGTHNPKENRPPSLLEDKCKGKKEHTFPDPRSEETSLTRPVAGASVTRDQELPAQETGRKLHCDSERHV